MAGLEAFALIASIAALGFFTGFVSSALEAASLRDELAEAKQLISDWEDTAADWEEMATRLQKQATVLLTSISATDDGKAP